MGGMSIANNLKSLRKAKKLSQPRLADLSGVSQQLISQIENGVNTTTKRLPELARAMGVSVAEIDPNYVAAEAPPAIRVPVISWVSAGSMQTPEAVQEIEDADHLLQAGLDPEGEWIALRVRGDSMDRISPPDSIIFVNLRDRRLVANACYVITDTESGEASYKRWRPSPDRWEPVSNNPVHEPMYLDEVGEPRVIGRVRRTAMDM